MGEQECVNPYYTDGDVTLYHGDCIEVMRALPNNSVDAVVTDPPYGINFMGRAWDGAAIAAAAVSGVDHTTTRERSASMHAGTYDLSLKGNRAFGAWCELWAVEAFRVLKPGGHLLAFSSARTWHRLTAAVEDSGFEIRDSIAWMYGSGFPKSLDVSKAIDKLDAVGARLNRARRFQSWLREYVTPQQVNEATGTDMGHHYTTHPTQPSVATVAHLDALRPLLPEVPEWIEEMCRQRTVESENFKRREVVGRATMVDTTRSRMGFAGETYGGDGSTREVDLTDAHTPEAARWQGWGTALKPAFEPVVVARKPLIGTVAANVQEYGTGALNIDACRIAGEASGRWPANVMLDESQAVELGGASRFFYTAKASSAERPKDGDVAHPTVKPLDLMRYLVRLVTPPGGTVLEPFAGSGTTAEACIVEGFKCIAIEMTDDYLPLIVQRITKPIEMTLL